MKKIHTRVFPLIEFNMLQKRFWKQKVGAQALQNYIKSSNVFSKKSSYKDNLKAKID